MKSEPKFLSVCLKSIMQHGKSKWVRKCIMHYITSIDTHKLSKGAGCVHCDCFTVMKLYFHLAFFKGDGSQVSVPRGFGPVDAKTAQQLRTWGSQMEVLETGLSLPQTSPADPKALSAASSDPMSLPFLPDLHNDPPVDSNVKWTA